MNIIKSVTARIEKRLTETKNPCKSYKSEQSADAATSKMAKFASDHFGCAESARYVVFYVSTMDRWVGAIDMTELVRRAEKRGGYLGVCEGFYSY